MPDAQNAAIALAGMAAPAGADPIAHGRFVVRTLEAGRYSEAWSRTQERINVPGTLKLKLDGEALACWLDPAHANRDGKCASEAEVRDMLREGAELMARYQRAIELPQFRGGLHSGILFLAVNKALFARIRLDLREGRPAAALQRWRTNQEFLARALKSRGTWIDKAILLVAQGYGFHALESILQQRFAIGAAEYQALGRLLRPEGTGAYDVEGTLREEHALFRPVFEAPGWTRFWVHPRFINNRFQRFSAAFAEAAQAPPAGLAKAFGRVEREHLEGWSADYLRDPVNAFHARALIRGTFKAWQMLRQMHILEGHKALLALRVEIRRRGVADAAIPALLAGSALRDPAGQAMRWDAAKRSLWFPIPDGEGARREVYL